jgi:penicillin-binding protein 1C
MHARRAWAWARQRRWLRWSFLASAVLALPWLALALAACFLSLPAPLAAPDARTTVLVLDRDGRLLREVSVGRGATEAPVRLTELSPWVVPALLAAEDARFYLHPGVDPLAVTRACGQLLLARRVVSGASTLTQQLARTLRPVPRNARGKLYEMALALRIEASLPKDRILEEYLSRVEFGPNLFGIDAASRHYFGKPASALDVAEAALLVSIPRGPSLYDPRRRPQLLERRRLRVLGRMERLGLLTPAELARAELTPMRVDPAAGSTGAEHLSFSLARRFASHAGERTRSLRTSLNAELQREAERVAKAALPSLTAHDGDAISLVVLDNETSDVLAYVGSPSYFDEKRQGANDGVVAKRQPGSTLKPFLYAAAMEDLGYGAATLLPDLPRDYLVRGGSFTPRNYDQHFRGPVLLRQALGSSLNLPALEVASRLGPPRLLRILRRFGFTSLERDAEHYGVGLALGDGEVTLLELASAYAALARGGELLAPRLVLARTGSSGAPVRTPDATAERVLAPELAASLSDMLSDDAARMAGFGRDSVLNLPFPVAAKTGTSKGFRDNWAVGYTREVTVAVWVGNFDGAPLREASGITAAGPAFHDLMLAAMRGRMPAPLFDRALLSEMPVCTLSGKRPGAVCPHRRLERFARGHEPGESCDIHVLGHLDAAGRESAARCGHKTQVLERYPIAFRAWAEQAGRPLAGANLSSRCPPEGGVASTPQVTFPREAQGFALDPDGPDRQEIVLTAAASSRVVRFIIDGQKSAEIAAPFRLPWRLSPGAHRVEVEADGMHSGAIHFRVNAP